MNEQDAPRQNSSVPDQAQSTVHAGETSAGQPEREPRAHHDGEPARRAERPVQHPAVAAVQRVEAPLQPAKKPDFASRSSPRRYQREASHGVTVKETSSEKSVATATVRPKARKNIPMMPPIQSIGRKTTTSTRVMVIAAMPDLAAAVERGFLGRLALVEVAVDVLQHHDAVVHQDADHQREPQHRHVVQRLPEEVHRDERGDEGRRDGDGADQGAAQVVQEEEDDDDREQRAQDQADVDVFQRVRGPWSTRPA